MPFKVIIIGGGLAGGLLANGLLKHEVDFAIYDRLPRHSPRDGYDIRVGGPALIGMRACLQPEHLRSIAKKFGRAGGRKSGAPVFRDRNFNTLIDLRVFPAYSKSAPIHRGTLRDAFADTIHDAGKMFYDKAFSKYELFLDQSTGTERVKVTFEDGAEDVCDLLIGADGSHSRINRQLGLDNIKYINSHVTFVTKGRLPTDKFLALPKRTIDAPILAPADQKTMFFAAYLPDRDVDTSNALAEVEGVEPSVVTHDEDLSTCFLAMQEPSATVPPEALTTWTAAERWNFISESISDWDPDYHKILDLIKGEDVYAFRARVASRPGKDWRNKLGASDKVWLIGDAMHAMLPSRGMGGNQSMRDTATALPLILRLAQAAEANKSPSKEDYRTACEDYEKEMIPRAFEWVQKSGGDNLMPVDSATFFGKVFFVLAAQVLNVAWVYYTVKSWFTQEVYMDDAPEFAD